MLWIGLRAGVAILVYCLWIVVLGLLVVLTDLVVGCIDCITWMVNSVG